MITALEALYLSLSKEERDYLIQLDMDIKAFANGGQTFIKIIYTNSSSNIMVSDRIRRYLTALGYKIDDVIEGKEYGIDSKLTGCIISWIHPNN